MTILPSPADYTDKDFAALNRRLELLIQQVFPAWTDYNRSSFGNILKECFCFAMDVLTFYQDQQAAETRWSTATLRSSIIELAKLINYSLSGATAATADVIFAIPNPLPGDVTIPIGTVVRTRGASPIRFQTMAATTITSGNTSSAAVSVEQSEAQEDTYTATGEKSEEFVLSQTPFLDDSETVVIGGDTWTKVDNFLDSTSTSKHYIILVDEEDQATVRTGDGTLGAVPALGAAVTISYTTGGGTQGNVEANTIVQVEGSFSDSLGNSTSITADNAAAATGGVARESVAEARINAPASLRVLNRTIARTDWEDLARRVAGIGRALMLTKAEDPTVPEYGLGYLFLVPDGGGTPSAALKTQVEDYINDNFPIPLNFSWNAEDPIYQTIDVVAYVYLEPDATETAVETAVLAALQAFFSPTNADGTPNEEIDFGYNYKDLIGDPDPKVALSTIYNIIHDTTGIRRLGTPADGEGLTLNAVQDDVDLTLRQFPQGGTLTLYNGDAGTIFPGHPLSI